MSLLNIELLKHPANWLIVGGVTLFAFAILSLLTPQADTE